ncbi:MAG: MaoC/PaaZ C-terminal domain-containing protein, partial [Gammaproteobacteria bacterium]
MPLDYAELMTRRTPDQGVSWLDRDAILYALAVGMNGSSAAKLAFVYEQPALQVLPSFASSLVGNALLDNCGWNYDRVLHIGERLTVHQSLTEAGSAILDSRVTGVRDLGADRGVLIEMTADARARSGQPLFRVQRHLLARADGGSGGPGVGLVDTASHSLPERAPDLDCQMATQADQALLYRLTGDTNPLHADPELARKLDWPRPPLHSLCTWGMACHAILDTICELDPTLVRAMEGRFSAPVFPGDTLITELWQQANIVSFRVRA